MVRRIGLGAGALALALGAAVGTAGTAGATPVTVTFSGAVSCTLTGHYHFAHALTDAGGVQTTVSVNAKLTGCNATDGAVTLTRGHLVAATTSTITNSWGAVTTGSPIPDLAGTITWKGTGGHITASTVTLSLQAMSYDSGQNVISISVKPVVTGGSFATQAATASGLASDLPGVTLAANAAHGVKNIAFGKTTPATFAIGA